MKKILIKWRPAILIVVVGFASYLLYRILGSIPFRPLTELFGGPDAQGKAVTTGILVSLMFIFGWIIDLFESNKKEEKEPERDPKRFTRGKTKEELVSLVDEVVEHLKKLTKGIVVYGYKIPMTPDDLVLEVSNLTPVGIEYINEYFYTLELIVELGKRKKTKRKKIMGHIVSFAIASLLVSFCSYWYMEVATKPIFPLNEFWKENKIVIISLSVIAFIAGIIIEAIFGEKKSES